MPKIKTFEKQPSENLDYDFDFSKWVPTGDTISSSVVTADSGITLGTKVNSDTNVKQFISGGTDDEQYKITCKITTAGGRTKEVDIRIAVRER